MMIKAAATTEAPTRLRRPWTADEIEYLRAHYATDGPATIGKRLGRARGSVKGRAYDLGLYVAKKRPTPPPWTPGDLAALATLYAKHGPTIAARIMGRPVDQVRRKAEALRLYSPDLAARQNRERWDAIAAAEAAAIREPDEPTDAKPGTLAKVQIMQERAAAGCWLFHDDDAPLAVDDPHERAPAEPDALEPYDYDADAL